MPDMISGFEEEVRNLITEQNRRGSAEFNVPLERQSLEPTPEHDDSENHTVSRRLTQSDFGDDVENERIMIG